ncbi:MAG: hypothetical protein ACMXYF_05990 [Candidatus Woesearchaeota archaeon]
MNTAHTPQMAALRHYANILAAPNFAYSIGQPQDDFSPVTPRDLLTDKWAPNLQTLCEQDGDRIHQGMNIYALRIGLRDRARLHEAGQPITGTFWEENQRTFRNSLGVGRMYIIGTVQNSLHPLLRLNEQERQHYLQLATRQLAVQKIMGECNTCRLPCNGRLDDFVNVHYNNT